MPFDVSRDHSTLKKKKTLRLSETSGAAYSTTLRHTSVHTMLRPPCQWSYKDTNCGNKCIRPSIRNTFIACSLPGKLTVAHFTKFNCVFLHHVSLVIFSLNPVTGRHLVPVEAVDILTLIVKIHFNITFYFCLRVKSDLFF